MYPLDVHRWYANGMLFNEVYDVNISAAKDGCVWSRHSEVEPLDGPGETMFARMGTV